MSHTQKFEIFSLLWLYRFSTTITILHHCTPLPLLYVSGATKNWMKTCPIVHKFIVVESQRHVFVQNVNNGNV